MAEADRDGDGKVSLHEFISVMSTSSLMHTRILQNLHPQESAKVEPSTSKLHDETEAQQVGFFKEINFFFSVVFYFYVSNLQQTESSEDSCECHVTDDDSGLVQHPITKRRRKKSVVGWLKVKSKSLKPNYPTKLLATSNNSNNNNNDKQKEAAPTKVSSNKRRRNSLTQKLSSSLGLMKKQILKSPKLKVISDEESD